MSLKAKSVACPKDSGLSIAFGSGDFRCTACGFSFPAKKTNKYNAKKSTVDGIVYDSNDEKSFILTYLVLRQVAGEVKDIRIKPKYTLEEGVAYRPEVTYWDVALATDITVDVKSPATLSTGRFPTVKRIWRNHMDHPLHIVMRDRKAKTWFTKQKINPRRKAVKTK